MTAGAPDEALIGKHDLFAGIIAEHEWVMDYDLDYEVCACGDQPRTMSGHIADMLLATAVRAESVAKAEEAEAPIVHVDDDAVARALYEYSYSRDGAMLAPPWEQVLAAAQDFPDAHGAVPGYWRGAAAAAIAALAPTAEAELAAVRRVIDDQEWWDTEPSVIRGIELAIRAAAGMTKNAEWADQ